MSFLYIILSIKDYMYNSQFILMEPKHLWEQMLL